MARKADACYHEAFGVAVSKKTAVGELCLLYILVSTQSFRHHAAAWHSSKPILILAYSRRSTKTA